MPLLGIAVILLQATFVIHAVRSGRSGIWVTIIVLLPVAGCLAYFVAEMLPEMRRSRAARRLADEATRMIAPDRQYNLLVEAVKDLPTADNKRMLAEELIHRGRYGEAEALYESALTPPHEHDPALLVGIAQAQFLAGHATAALASLDKIQAHNPGYQSHPAHLLYARALAAAGRSDEALAEYAALVPVFPGEEARCRYALLLQQKGEVPRARDIFSTVRRSVEKGSRHYRAEQKEWYEMARHNLGEGS